MGTRSKHVDAANIDPTNAYNEFAHEILTHQVSVGTAAVDQVMVETVMPWAGRILSADFQVSTLTDIDASGLVAPYKNGVALQTAQDPSGGLSIFVEPHLSFVSVANVLFALGDRLQTHVKTATDDVLVGTMTYVVRPALGTQERLTASLGDA